MSRLLFNTKKKKKNESFHLNRDAHLLFTISGYLSKAWNSTERFLFICSHNLMFSPQKIIIGKLFLCCCCCCLCFSVFFFLPVFLFTFSFILLLLFVCRNYGYIYNISLTGLCDWLALFFHVDFSRLNRVDRCFWSI